MTILDLINKKKIGGELTEEEIDYFVKEFTINKSIKDYQASSLLMACRTMGLSTYETFYITKCFVKYSKTYDFKKGFEKQILIDKHSSGGVGDKVTLIIGPLLAALGYRTVKISGRGLGHTGGTIDKLDSIKVNTDVTEQLYKKWASKSNCIIMQQNDDLVPSDKVIYGLRDVTGTVDSYGLIASSILSKKFIINSDHIFIDLKVGTGALMKNKKDAIKLSKLMLDVAYLMKRNINISITSMDQPLGRAVGNLIEVVEAYDFLCGKSNTPQLSKLIEHIITEILLKTKKVGNKQQAKTLIHHTIESGDAKKYFMKWIHTQGGTFDPSKFKPKFKLEIKANNDGYVNVLDTKEIGMIALELGAGRLQKTDKIDYQAGIFINKSTGELVKKGDVIATLYSSKPIHRDLINKYHANITITPKQPKQQKMIIKSL